MDQTGPAGNVPKPHEWRWTAAVAAAAFHLLSPGIFWGLPFGKAVLGADRILAGDVLREIIAANFEALAHYGE